MEERERTDLIFVVAFGLIAAVWYSNRERRHYVDDTLAEQGRELEAHKQRAAARRGMMQAVVTVIGTLVAIGTVLAAFGVHP